MLNWNAEIKHNFEVDDETFEDVGVPYDTSKPNKPLGFIISTLHPNC